MHAPMSSAAAGWAPEYTPAATKPMACPDAITSSSTCSGRDTRTTWPAACLQAAPSARPRTPVCRPRNSISCKRGGTVTVVGRGTEQGTRGCARTHKASPGAGCTPECGHCNDGVLTARTAASTAASPSHRTTTTPVAFPAAPARPGLRPSRAGSVQSVMAPPKMPARTGGVRVRVGLRLHPEVGVGEQARASNTRVPAPVH
jgi:hypothetical protein